MEVTSIMVGGQAAFVAPLQCKLFSPRAAVFGSWRTAPSRVRLNLRRSWRPPAIRAAVREEATDVVEKKQPTGGCKQHIPRPQLFVGLPVDAVSEGNTLNHAKAIAAGLKALKLLGVDGVELPVWWGIVEKDAMGKYDWSAYLAIARMIQDAGLQIHASLYFHASKTPAILLPKWVTSIGNTNPNIYFTNKAGSRQKVCLSLSVDNLPVLGGKTPVQVYEAFFQNFQDSFADLMGSTITNVTIGLGPGGELRYPSLASAKKQKVIGAGEFQCYDSHMLAHLKQHADGSGNHYWGLSGPHDAPRGDQTPESGNFFRDQGGSWETPYGDFFLSWYSEQLLSHGDRILCAAAAAFSKYNVTISARVPFVHSWYKTRSHALELTSGYYNTDGRDGYDSVARMFTKNNCKIIVTGMDLTDAGQPTVFHASPESLLSQIVGACTRHGVRICGENSSVATAGLDKIKSIILDENSQGKPSMDSFIYQRMGASFFSPEHWPHFTEFIRSIGRPKLHVDDLLSKEKEQVAFSVGSTKASTKENAPEMQAV